MTRAIHDRYHASHRNPYNEIECSDHYSRDDELWLLRICLRLHLIVCKRTYTNSAARMSRNMIAL